MSPSTKNLREKIWKILDQSNTWKESADKLESLLSSELSLAVKGLREAIETRKEDGVLKIHTHGKDCGVWCRNVDACLSSFDSKAKELLGESS